MRKIVIVLGVTLFSVSSCKTPPKSLKDKISQAVLNIEWAEISDAENIESLRVDSVEYTLTSPRTVYSSIREDIKPGSQLISAESGLRKYQSGNAGLTKTEENELIRGVQNWLDEYGILIKAFDSACNHADTSHILYQVKYLLKGKTNKQSYNSWQQMYVTKDELWKADNYDSIKRRMSYIPDPPLN